MRRRRAAGVIESVRVEAMDAAHQTARHHSSAPSQVDVTKSLSGWCASVTAELNEPSLSQQDAMQDIHRETIIAYTRHEQI